MMGTRSYRLLLVAVLIQSLSGFNAKSANIGANPSDPNCPIGADMVDGSCTCQDLNMPGLQSAAGTPVGSDGMGGPGMPAGGGCSSGSCGNGGLNPQFPANTGVNGAGFAGFSLNLGAPSTPGGLGGGVLFFQIKTLDVTGHSDIILFPEVAS